MRFFRTFFISQPIKLKFGTGIQNWILILIFASKSGLGDDFGQYDTKTIILRRSFAKRLLEIVLPWQHLRCHDQKLFERVCYMLNLNVTKFQLPTPTVSELY